MGLISGNVSFHAELSFSIDTTTSEGARGEGGHDRRRRAAVTVVAVLDSSIGPGLATVCDFAVQENCERVKGETPHSLHFTERKWIRQDFLPQRTVVLLTTLVAGEGGIEG